MEIIEINVLGPWQFYNVDGRYYSAKQYHNLLKDFDRQKELDVWRLWKSK